MRYFGGMSQTATQARQKRYRPVPKHLRERGAVGRPSSFGQERIDEAVELCLAGATDQELCEKFGVSTTTLYRWKQDYPEFREATRSAKGLCDHRVERTLLQKALGYDYVEQQAIKVSVGDGVQDVEVVDVQRHVPPSDTAAIFWLKNRDPNRWRDKQEIDLNGSLQVEDAGSRDLALAMIGLLRAAGSDAESQPVTIDHQPAQDAPAPAPVAQDRRRRVFG